MKLKWDDDDQKYIKLGLTAFVVVILCILANQVLHQLPLLTEGIRALFSCLRPIVFGLVFAYVLSPVLNMFERFMFWLGKFKYTEKIFNKCSKGGRRIVRGTAVVLTWGLAFLMAVFLVQAVVPEIISSIEGIISNMPVYVNKLTRWVSDILKDNPEISSRLINQIRTFYKDFNSVIDSVSEVIPNLSEFVTNLSNGVFNAVSGFFDLIIGIIVSIYVLASREKFISQGKKLVYSILSAKHANSIAELFRAAHVKFGGFFLGKIIDSIVIGVICYIMLRIFSIPYAVLVSFVVGVTNIIPFFGPFIGAIPCAVIILLADPVKCLYFIIIIIVLQQVDGNILGPKILSTSIGLSSFWVMFSILVFGGVFGFWGLICGVPMFAVIYDLVSAMVNRRLEAKNLSTNTADYQHLDYVDEETGEIINLKEKDAADEFKNKQGQD